MSRVADLAQKALSRGDLIGAYDATVTAIAGGDDSNAIRHQQILALEQAAIAEHFHRAFQNPAQCQ